MSDRFKKSIWTGGLSTWFTGRHFHDGIVEFGFEQSLGLVKGANYLYEIRQIQAPGRGKKWLNCSRLKISSRCWC